MKTVHLVDSVKVCAHLNKLFPDGVPVSDEPEVQVQNEDCYLAEPQSDEDAKAMAAIALSDDAPMGLLMSLQLHHCFPIPVSWVVEG